MTAVVEPGQVIMRLRDCGRVADHLPVAIGALTDDLRVRADDQLDIVVKLSAGQDRLGLLAGDALDPVFGGLQFLEFLRARARNNFDLRRRHDLAEQFAPLWRGRREDDAR